MGSKVVASPQWHTATHPLLASLCPVGGGVTQVSDVIGGGCPAIDHTQCALKESEGTMGLFWK